MIFCDYGCGQEAIYQLKNGKWCCSKNIASCPHIKLKISKKNAGMIFSEEHRKKISDSKIGKEPWNKKITDYLTDEIRLSMGSKNKGKEPWNKGKTQIYSDETIKKMSESRKKYTGKNHPMYEKKHTALSKKKMSESKKGLFSKEQNSFFGKNHTDETKNKLKLKNKITIEIINERYPLFSKIEEMRYNPDKPNEKEIQVHCKNHNCPNSKEKEGWFTPTGNQFDGRRRALEEKNGNDGSYFYCSDKCKNECPLFNLKSDPFQQPQAKLYTQEEYQIFREFVLERDNYICQYCGNLAEHVHHERPQKLEPFFSLDPDLAWSVCLTCHYKYAHKGECSTGQLANIICKK